MKPQKLPPVELLREMFEYNPESGSLVWRRRISGADADRWNTRYAGKTAGSVDRLGYRVITIGDRKYKAHRVCWAIACGDPGEAEIDHADCDRLNNRLCNLRLASRQTNIANSRRHRDGVSGYKGVTPASSGKWIAQIKVSGEQRYLGRYKSRKEAHAAYKAAAWEAFGSFARFE